MAAGSKTCGTAPGRERGRLLRHLCFSSSFPRRFNPGGSGHVKGARAHRAERGRPLTWPRQDYIALLEEEEKRRSNRQPPAAARGRPPPCAPLPWLAVRGRSTRPPPVPSRTQPGSERPFDLQRSASDLRGVWGHVAPRCPPAHASAAPATKTTGRCCTDRLRTAVPIGRPLVVREEGVQGGATGLRRDRAMLRLAPEEAARRQPATAVPAGLFIARRERWLPHWSASTVMWLSTRVRGKRHALAHVW